MRACLERSSCKLQYPLIQYLGRDVLQSIPWIHLLIVREIWFFPEHLVFGWRNWQHDTRCTMHCQWISEASANLITCAYFLFNFRERCLMRWRLYKQTHQSCDHGLSMWTLQYCVFTFTLYCKLKSWVGKDRKVKLEGKPPKQLWVTCDLIW